MDVDKVLYVILAILIMILPFSNLLLSQVFPILPVSNEGGNITDAILAATAVALLCYTRITKKLYKTTFDSNRLNSFSGLFVDKKSIEEQNVIKVENNTNNSVLDVFIISFLFSEEYKPKLLYKEIQPFIHPKQPIVQSDILKDFRPDLDLGEKFSKFSNGQGFHLVIGLLTPLMEKKEAMIFYFNSLSEQKFQHRHYNNKQKIYKASITYIWKEYQKECKRKN